MSVVKLASNLSIFCLYLRGLDQLMELLLYQHVTPNLSSSLSSSGSVGISHSTVVFISLIASFVNKERSHIMKASLNAIPISPFIYLLLALRNSWRCCEQYIATSFPVITEMCYCLTEKVEDLPPCPSNTPKNGTFSSKSD